MAKCASTRKVCARELCHGERDRGCRTVGGGEKRKEYSHRTLAAGGEGDVDEAAGVLSTLLWRHCQTSAVVCRPHCARSTHWHGPWGSSSSPASRPWGTRGGVSVCRHQDAKARRGTSSSIVHRPSPSLQDLSPPDFWETGHRACTRALQNSTPHARSRPSRPRPSPVHPAQIFPSCPSSSSIPFDDAPVRDSRRT